RVWARRKRCRIVLPGDDVPNIALMDWSVIAIRSRGVFFWGREMRAARAASLALMFWTVAAFGASAGQLVYKPVNPSFGGDPLNSSHLMGLASAQRTATAPQPSGGSGGGDPGTTPGSSDADLF